MKVKPKTVETMKAEDAPTEEQTDSKPADDMSEVLMLVRAVAEMMKRQSEVSDLILAKLEQDAASDSTEEGGGEAPQQDAAKTADSTVEVNTDTQDGETSEKRLQALEDSLKAFNTKFDKVIETVKLLATMVRK